MEDKAKRLKEQKHIIRLKKMIYIIAYFTDQYHPVHKGIKGMAFGVLHMIFSIFLGRFNYDKLYQKMEDCCKKHRHEQLEYVSFLENVFESSLVPVPFFSALHVSFLEQLQKWDCVGKRPRSFFTDLKKIRFESIRIPVARQSVKLVKRIYGENYMEPLQDKRTTHGEVYFDTRNSYVNYIR